MDFFIFFLSFVKNFNKTPSNQRFNQFEAFHFQLFHVLTKSNDDLYYILEMFTYFAYVITNEMKQSWLLFRKYNWKSQINDIDFDIFLLFAWNWKIFCRFVVFVVAIISHQINRYLLKNQFHSISWIPANLTDIFKRRLHVLNKGRYCCSLHFSIITFFLFE